MTQCVHRLAPLHQLLLILTVTLVSSPAVRGGGGRDEIQHLTDILLLVLGPYPNSRGGSSDVGWVGGPALFPAAQFAADLINNRSDLLPGRNLRLVNGDSGCAYGGRAVVTFAREREAVTRSHGSFAGIVGPACSSAAVDIGGITTPEHADVPSITIANGPGLQTANLNNMFRIYSSARLSARALFALMQQASWTSVAVVVDASHWYFPQIYSSFRSEIVGTSTEEYSVELLNFQSPFSSIRNRYNVIIVFADTRHSAKSLCMAAKLNLLFPDYQWIFFDVETENLLMNISVVYNSVRYNCTRQEMRRAAHKAIVIRPRLIPEDRGIKTHSGLTYEEYFHTYYHEYYLRHLRDESISQDDVHTGAEEWAAAYFDSVWAFALAMNRSIEREESLATGAIREELLGLNFSGLTGNIHFHRDTLAVPSTMDIYQLDKAHTRPRKIGSFYEETLIVLDNSDFVDPIRKKVVVVYTVAVALFFSVGIILLAMIGGVHLIYVVFRHYQSIRAQSPHFVHIIFSGCYLYILAALLDTVRAANWTGFSDIDSSGFRISIGTICNVIFWCLALSTALIFGTMCVLSWRIYRIFTHFLNPGVWIADPILAGFIIALLTLNIAVLVTWSSHDPLLVRFDLADEGLMAGVLPFYQRCDCNHFVSWLAVCALNEVFIFLVVVLAIFNRKVPKKDYVNNTRSYNGTVYIMSFVNGICVPIYFAFSNTNSINLSYVFFQLLTLGSPLTALLLLFLPPVVPLFRTASVKLKKYRSLAQ